MVLKRRFVNTHKWERLLREGKEKTWIMVSTKIYFLSYFVLLSCLETICWCSSIISDYRTRLFGTSLSSLKDLRDYSRFPSGGSQSPRHKTLYTLPLVSNELSPHPLFLGSTFSSKNNLTLLFTLQVFKHQSYDIFSETTTVRYWKSPL